MLVSTSPVQILWRGTYSDEAATGQDRVAFRSGKLVEHVKFLDADSGELIDWSLAEHVNGEVNVGQTVTLTAACEHKLVGMKTSRGGDYTVPKYKFKILDAKPVSPNGNPAGATKSAA